MSLRRPTVLVTPCGTSILTNNSERTVQTLLFKYTNAPTLEAIPIEERTLIADRVAAVRALMENAAETGAAEQSAELYSLLKFYEGKIERGADVIFLLCTDTYLGEQAASIVQEWLLKHGVAVIKERRKDLRTDDLLLFQSALSDLVRWCDETLTYYRTKRYEIVFNLTGGFKGILNFLQVLSLFYGDRSIYTFDRGILLSIPRLPVKMSVEQEMRDNVTILRRLDGGLPVESTGTLPEAILLHLDEETALSEWGELIWKQNREELYGERLWESPSAKIAYGPKFADSCKGLMTDRLYHINDNLDWFMLNIEGNGSNKRSLNIHSIANAGIPPSTHEFYAWSDSGAWRIYFHYEEANAILDFLGEHL